MSHSCQPEHKKKKKLRKRNSWNIKSTKHPFKSKTRKTCCKTQRNREGKFFVLSALFIMTKNMSQNMSHWASLAGSSSPSPSKLKNDSRCSVWLMFSSSHVEMKFAASQWRRRSPTTAVNFPRCSRLSRGDFTFLLAASSGSSCKDTHLLRLLACYIFNSDALLIDHALRKIVFIKGVACAQCQRAAAGLVQISRSWCEEAPGICNEGTRC